MFRIVPLCCVIYALFNPGQTVSSKLDFGNEETTYVAANETKEDEDVEVKHTIVVSTRLKNNNRRGLHGRGEGEPGVLTYNLGRSSNKEDSGEVPVVDGFKAVDTTQIRTPDTRHKGQIYPDSVFINRNIRDEYDIYPNVALTPNQWKPSNFFNNVNWWQDGRPPIERRNYRPINNSKLNRKISDDAMRDFYCKKCRELSVGENGIGCFQQRSARMETTTAKVKLDGKLAKLN